MAILTNDLVILASESMDDSAAGGGGLVEKPIINGQSNNIFKDISSLKRAYGGVNLAKVFAALRTPSNEALLGAFVIISKIPGDKKLSVNLFSTGDHYDVRTDAAARIESYRTQGGKYFGFLYGTQYTGSQVVIFFQTEESQSPAIGDVLLLKRLSPAASQYIRVTAVSVGVQTFMDAQGAFRRKIVTLEIATPLQYDFVGIELNRFDGVTAPSQAYTTTVANAARYFSARYVKAAVSLGDYFVTVDSVYSQVVPSSQSETPLTDITAAGSSSPLIPAASAARSVSINYALGANVGVYLGRSVVPGSLELVYSDGRVVDDGGLLKIGGMPVGTINYKTGFLSLGATAPSVGSGVVAHFVPAGLPLTVADTDAIMVSDANRAFVYTFNINPPPPPAALSVSYLVAGNWYELRDAGAGALVPLTDGTGAGTINYVTGSVTLTCAALPDVGSAIILAWGKRADYAHHAGGSVRCAVSKQLAHTDIVATSLVITWVDDAGITKSVVSDAAGLLSGDGTGQLSAAVGFVKFFPTLLPAKGTTFHFNYQYNEGVLDVVKKSKVLSDFGLNGHVATIDLLDENVVPGSVSIAWDLGWGSSVPAVQSSLEVGMYVTLPAIASGVAKNLELDNGAGGLVSGRTCAIDYAAGVITLNWHTDVPLKFPILVAWNPPMHAGLTVL